MEIDFKWCKIDILSKPHFFSESDETYYGREHIVGGYEASPSNQLIFNLKKLLVDIL